MRTQEAPQQLKLHLPYLPSVQNCSQNGRFDDPARCFTECPEYTPELPCHCQRLLLHLAVQAGGFTRAETAAYLGVTPRLHLQDRATRPGQARPQPRPPQEPTMTSSTVNNYFSVRVPQNPLAGIFTFNHHDPIATAKAFDNAMAMLQHVRDVWADAPAAVAVYQRPPLKGPWSAAPVVGE